MGAGFLIHSPAVNVAFFRLCRSRPVWPVCMQGAIVKRQKIIEKKGTGRLQDLQKKLDAGAGEKFRDLQEKLDAGAGEKFRDLQEKINTETGEKLQQLQERIGDRAENAIGSMIENSRLKAPELSVGPGEPGAEAPALFVRPGRGPGFEIPEPEAYVWYRVPVEGGQTADGSAYHIYVRKGASDHLCVFLSGGGIAWNPYTAARPVTGGRVLAWEPNYYWSNLRSFTQVYNIGVGITDNSARRNPFRDWNFVVVTYATGDLHLGRNRYCYRDDEGVKKTLLFHGYDNFLASMRIARTLFPCADRLLIAGESAGAFAVPALAEQIHREFYPMCGDDQVILFSDSALLLNKGWKKTAADVWNIREDLVKQIRTRNITLDWYRGVYARRGEHYRYLYASSVQDYLLSAFYNDLKNKKYDTDEKVQRIFQRQLREMVRELRKITSAFGIYLYDWHRPVLYRGGTIHTMVRQPEFYLHRRGMPSMAKWLSQAVEGTPYCVGLNLLKK